MFLLDIQLCNFIAFDSIFYEKNCSQSIHGKGLFERGLIVAAACTDCHTAHSVLPHTDPNSTINRKNIAHTCEQCHAGIERVHKKIINGKLWESSPNKVPACIDCHQLHDIRQVIYEEKFTDQYCMNCHKDKKLFKMIDGRKEPLFVDYEKHKNSGREIFAFWKMLLSMHLFAHIQT